MSSCRLGNPVHVIWRHTPPSPAQMAAWRWLWARLLGHVDPTPEIPQPQDQGGPRAIDWATVSSGHNLLSELPNDTGNTPRSK